MRKGMLVLLAAIGAKAADVPIIAKAIYGNIATTSTIKQEAIILLNPSQTIQWPAPQPKLLELALQNLADSLPEPQWVFTQKKESLRDVLNYIVANAKFAKTAAEEPPADELTPAEAQLLFENGDRTQPSEAYKKFLDLSQRITAAGSSIKKEPDPHKRAELDLERSQAALRLSSLPQLEDIRRAARKLAGAGVHPSSINRARLQKMLAAYQGPRFTPQIDKWNDPSGWVKIEASLNTNFDTPIFTAGPSDLTGNWWVPAPLDGSFGKKASKISFEVKRVLIDRSGLDLSIFDAKNWKFGGEALISDGQSLVAGNAMHGRMPLLVTGLLLSRNIVITTPSSSEAQTAAISASGQNYFRFGTLMLGGSYPVPATKDRFYPALGARGVTSPELQVVAFLCNQLPLSPNPDPNLKW